MTHVSDHALGMPIGDGRVLDLGATFPSLQFLYMDTVALREYGDEELGNILQIANTSPHLKYLELDTSTDLKALVSILPITFHHLETLVLHSRLFEEAHLQLLAAVKWPSLTTLLYWSDEVYSTIVPTLLKNAPRLRRFTARMYSSQGFFSSLVEAFGEKEWSNLQCVCIVNWNGRHASVVPDYMSALQKACPNASIHVTLKKGIRYEATLAYGAHLPPQCNWTCYRCTIK
jgi:hypothetical protein